MPRLTRSVVMGRDAIERLVCEGLDGTFTSAPTIERPHRANWACIPGPTSGYRALART